MIVGQVIVYGFSMVVCLVCLMLMVYEVINPYWAIVGMCMQASLVVLMHYVIFRRMRE